MEESLAQRLKSRGFVSGYQATPLRKFWGTFHSYKTEQTPFGRLRINYNFINADPIETSEPYDLPTAIIGINYSDRTLSANGIFMGSVYSMFGGEGIVIDKIAKHFGVEPDTVDVEGSGVTTDLPDLFPAVLENSRVLMALTPGHRLGANRQTGQDIVIDAWEIVEVAGEEVGIVDPKAEALRLLEGKTTPQFNQAALQSAVIKADEGFRAGIIDKSWLKKVEAQKLATKDARGIWHLV